MTEYPAALLGCSCCNPATMLYRNSQQLRQRNGMNRSCVIFQPTASFTIRQLNADTSRSFQPQPSRQVSFQSFQLRSPTSWNTHRSSPQCPVHIFDPQNSQSKQKSCFMPMYFRVLCYGAIANRYRMTKFSVVPYNYNIKLSDN